MQRGTIFDVYADQKRNVMVTWLLTKRGPVRLEDTYTPRFYVHASSEHLYKLASDLQDIPQVAMVNLTQCKFQLGSDKTFLVLEVTPKHLKDLMHLASLVDLWGHSQQYQLYNVDLRLPTRYLHSKDVFCNASVNWDGTQFILDDDQWAIDYEFPPFTSVHLAIPEKKRFPSFQDPLTALTVDDAVCAEETEEDTLLAAVHEIHRRDPDIIFTTNGDSVLFPYVYHRARHCGINAEVNFGRDDTSALRPVKQAFSYFSYGRIAYRPGFYTLKGRAHLDTHGSFLFGESGLKGLVEISRCSNIPLQLQSRLGPGTAISQIQVNTAMSKGYLIPWKKNLPETWKTAYQLLLADRGGLVLSPRVGLHEDVIELDYASLYPSIMVQYNISPETMLCDCCPGSPLQVPQLGYHLCIRQQGLLPEVLKPILDRRFCFKARAKHPTYDHELYKELQQAWKWILIVCFGYTGYKNARYGRIECHESITAFARDILLKAVHVAEKAGYHVLHGIVDSLWVTATTPQISAYKLSRLIANATAIRMDVEGHYHWIVFLPSKQTGVGALTRYYGLLDTGEMKIRGIEARQRNTPKFLRETQQQMLQILAKGTTADAMKARIPDALDMMIAAAQQLEDGLIPLHELIYTAQISRDVTEYKVNTLTKAALLKLQDRGIRIEPGQSIQYAVHKEHTTDHNQRVWVAEELDTKEAIDVSFYQRQLAQCAESILVPFGYTKERLETMLTTHNQQEVTHASLLS